MSDIFAIKGVNTVLQVGDREFRFADPKFPDKILLRKEMNTLAKEHELGDITYEEYLEGVYVINRKMMKQYLPDITDDVLDELGDFSFQALLNKVSELTETKFGAIVEKVEKK